MSGCRLVLVIVSDAADGLLEHGRRLPYGQVQVGVVFAGGREIVGIGGDGLEPSLLAPHGLRYFARLPVEQRHVVLVADRPLQLNL